MIHIYTSTVVPLATVENHVGYMADLNLLEDYRLVHLDHTAPHNFQAEEAEKVIEKHKAKPRFIYAVACVMEPAILRILRRVREGKLSHEDVKVFVLSYDANEKEEVCECRVDGDGDFIDSWPDGFFEACSKELFAEGDTDGTTNA